MRTVEIYIDTGIKGPKPRDGLYMYIIATQTNRGSADAGNSEYLENTTEHKATLMALEAALKRLNQPCQLEIYMEDSYVAAVLQNGWAEGWKNNGWRNAKNELVEDAEKWRSIQSLLNGHEVQVHVKKHHSYREWMARTIREKEEEHRGEKG
ncbi:MAG: hypothetical protein IJ335_06465 [Lachnospiraceae bacterium]|nr:hypothetical protein [Lachnospiraceae bacterium]